MKTKTTMTVILFFSSLSLGSAFGKTRRLTDLDKLNRPFYRAAFMKKVIDADSISRVFDATPVNDYENFRMKLVPEAGAILTRRRPLVPGQFVKKRQQKEQVKKKKPRLSDFNFFGSEKKEL